MVAAGGTSFVGRASERAALVASVETAAWGPCQVAFVEGEAGIGKTRLLAEAVQAARARGTVVHIGIAAELERARPFGALAEAFGLNASSSDPERAAIGRLLIGDVKSSSSTRLFDEPPGIRFRLVETLLTLVERLCLRGAVLIAIEDLHWADPSTLLTLDQLAKRLAHARLAIFGTFRPFPVEGERERALRHLVSRASLHITLDRMPDDEVSSLIEGVVGVPPTPHLLTVVDRAGGHPLFVIELVSALSREGAIFVRAGLADVEDFVLPSSLRRVILRQLEMLSADAFTLSRLASVLGVSFSLSDLSTVLDRPSSDLVPALEEAIRAGVLGDDGGRLVFRHELVREAIYSDLSTAVRRALHVQAGRALAAAGAPPTQVAPHFSASTAQGDREAVGWLRRAARDAARRAPSVAVELLERATQVQDESDPDRGVVLAELSAALAWSGRLSEAEALARDVLLRGASDVEIPLRVTLAEAMMARGRGTEAFHEMQAAIARSRPDDPDGPRLLAFAAWTRLYAGDLRGAVADERQALAAAERRGDEGARSVALCVLSIASYMSGDVARAVDLASEAINASAQDPSRYLDRYPARLFLGRALLDRDAVTEADRAFREGIRLSEDLGLGVHLPYYHAQLGLLLFVTGAWDDAAAELEAAVRAGEEEQSGALILPRSVLALIDVHRNALSDAEELLAFAEKDFANTGSLHGASIMVWAQALLLESQGELDAAVATLEAAWAGPIIRIAPDLVRVGPDIVRLAMSAGRVDLARGVVEALEHATGRNKTATSRGALLRARGLLTQDPELLIHASAAYDDGPRPLERALAFEDAASLLSELGRSEEAARLLGEAIEFYERSRAVADLTRADASLRALGIRRGRKGPRRRPSTGWASLTPTETEIVRLVVGGLTNSEIGRRLFISRRTVETHLSHVFGKLGMKSRVLLAAEAARRSELEPIGRRPGGSETLKNRRG